MAGTATYETAFFTSFNEPHTWWDLYDARREGEYQDLIAGKTCLDCGKCRVCERDSSIGFCMEDHEFVYGDESVYNIGCECFE